MLSIKVLSSGSQGNCYLLNYNNETLILDCGISIKEIKKGLNFDISRVVGICISHAHLDHSLSVKDLCNMGIKCCNPYEMDLLDGGLPKRMGVTYGSFRVNAFTLPHNNTPNYGYLISVGGQKILYMTDFEYCEYVFTKQKVDHILIECNYQQELVSRDLPNYEHKIRGHCSLDTCKKFIEINKSEKLKTVLLLHMGAETCNAMECVEQVHKIVGDNVYVNYARKGLEVELKENGCPF